MSPTAILDVIRADLERAADPAYRTKIAELVPTGVAIVGVRVPAIRNLAQVWHKAHNDLAPDAAIDLLATAFERRCREEVLFTVVLLSRLKKKLTPAHLQRIDPLIDRVEDWEACDQFSAGVVGEIVGSAIDAGKRGEVARLEKWAKSKNPWRRRAAIAATTAFNQKGRRHAGPTLAVCRHAMEEKDAGVKKAVGWALREATKSDARAVYDFLASWKDRAARRILSEGSQKLSAARRKALLGSVTPPGRPGRRAP